MDTVKKPFSTTATVKYRIEFSKEAITRALEDYMGSKFGSDVSVSIVVPYWHESGGSLEIEKETSLIVTYTEKFGV